MSSAHVFTSLSHPPEMAPWALARSMPRPAMERTPGSSALLQAVLDALGLGLLLVDSQGQVLLCNRSARAICKRGMPATVEGRQLCMAPDDHLRLLQALRAAQRGLRAMLMLRRDQQAMAIGVVPMAGDDSFPHMVAMLVLGPSAPLRGLALQFFSQAHQLTAAESTVLAGLSIGQRPGAIAAAGQVQVSTVRTQVASIRSKTQSASIGHLLQQLSSLPPLAPQNLADG